jgi:hypothetical protein
VQDLVETAGDLDATTAFPRRRWLAGPAAGVEGSGPRTRLVIAAVVVVLALLLGSAWTYLHYLRGPGPAVLFQAAEGMAIDPAEARRLREDAERLAEEEGAQLQLLDARAALDAGRYDQVVATAREMLETRAGREKAATVLEEVEDALSRGVRESPPPRPARYNDAEAAPLPAPTPEALPTIDYGVLHVELRSEAPKGVLALWIDDQPRVRHPFDFYERALFRKRPVPGTWSADFAVPSGTHALKLLLVRPGEPGHVSLLDAAVDAGALRTLAVSFPARGEPTVELR